jgi:glycosyltransferase involved in cell wall biosynthesis
MKVLFVLHQTILMGGGTKSFKVMLKGLMQKGVEPVVAMPDHQGVYREIAGLNIRTIVVPFRDNTYPWVRSVTDVLLFLPRIVVHGMMNAYAVAKITHEARQAGVEMVHTNVSVCSIGFRVSRRLGIPHVYHIREYADLDFDLHFFPTRGSYLRKLSSPSSFNICITKDIQRHFGQTGNRCSRVIYNGIQPSEKELPVGEKENYFLYAGRVIAAKGVSELVEAYSAYLGKTRHSLPLYIVGEQPDAVFLNMLKNYIEQHHMGGHVSLFGQRSDVRELMKHARAIIIPSRNEGFGRCMPEAMFCGCLTVGRNTGGTCEQMDNGLALTGGEISLRYDTEEQLTQILLEVSENSMSYYAPWIERAFRTVNQLYTAESNVDSVYEFYLEIMKSERERR